MRFFLKNLFLVLLLSFLGCGYFIFYTEAGLQATIRMLTSFAPGKLTIQTAAGKLATRFTIKNVSYQDPDQRIDIQKLDVEWNPLGLFHDKILLEKIILDNAKIKLTRTQQESSGNNTWLRFLIVKQFIVKHLYVQYADAEVSFDGTLNKNWNVNWQATIPHLSTIAPEYAGSIISSGTITGPFATPEISAMLKGDNVTVAEQKIKNITGKLHFNFRPGTRSMLALTAYDVRVNKRTLAKLNINMEGNVIRKNAALIANLNLNVADQYNISGVLSLPKFTRISDLSQPLSGQAVLHSTELNYLSNLIPYIKKPQGSIHAKLSCKGTLGQPVLSGEMILNNGQVELPKLGIKLHNIHLHLLSDNLQKITYLGSLQSGKGVAKLQGVFDLNDTSLITLVLKGDDLDIIKLREYTVTASPDLTLQYMNQHLQLSGAVVIPYADLSPDNFENTVTLPSEVVFEDQELKEIKTPFDVSLKISLRLGNKIHVGYKNLQADLSGKLKIIQNHNGPITAAGELYAIKGTYRTYGQVLKIQEGRLIYTGGSLSNPGLNIRAIKQIKTVLLGGESSFDKLGNQPFRPVYTGTELITLGVQIEGSLEHHDISLFSIPGGLSQKEILAYLTLGHSVSQATSQQHSALLNAASALNLGGKSKFGDITEKLQDKLGLTELDFTSTEVFNPTDGKVSSKTAFVIGKEITPSLSAHYSKSLFDPMQTLNLRYQLSKRFAIQSETSTIGNGADLLYSIERD